MATWIVETGASLASSNTYLSLASITSWCNERGLTAWASAATTAQESALFNAMDFIEAYEFKGIKTALTQTLKWPRDDCYDEDQFLIAWNTIPQRVKNALCQACYEEIVSPKCLQPNLSSSDYVTEKTIDVLSWKYSRVISGTVFQKIEEYLKPFLVSSKLSSTSMVDTLRV